MFIAANQIAFQRLFVSRLHQMLSADELGAFILVLANSMQHASLKSELSNELRKVYEELVRRHQAGELVATHDDLVVFEKLLDYGIDNIPVWEAEAHGSWRLLNNPMRALRPPRASSETVDSVHKLFDESRFNFNKPFLKPEILWEGDWSGTNIRVLYNKFPFIDYHSIIVPDPEACMPQLLNAQAHELIWQIISTQQSSLPGLAAGYNSMGACASVNHLHFQGFIQKQTLPIENAMWQHNGGDEIYPMYCEVYDSVEESMRRIEHFNRKEQAYNILYRPQRCYLMPRQMQGSHSVNARVQGAGWIEECGVFSISDWSIKQGLTAEVLYDDLRSLSIDQ